VDLDEISYEGDNIEGDLDSMLLNGGCLTFWGEGEFWTEWWIWMKCCMGVMALNITSTTYYLIP
jgi:hypothetical protein